MWIGHTVRKEEWQHHKTSPAIEPSGKRKRGTPRKTWHRSWDEEIKIWKLRDTCIPLNTFIPNYAAFCSPWSSPF